ncbi:MAG: hypothetical protein A3G33_10420 [Omnitrophica bacterium RIFCSPLOWO2_12_FULL_44_17]|uniref:Transcriptional repressor n=1 Tax=Candidatus Danuiimicrobium aquiferis TaxID=1801832 RepID=A0A1G1KS59_9BACT|nr:MAG: hypothetical protein A3B72_02735 [Omnitrophica bacterium RIFCSPHIGHO2_02_FULL_45_28]OGW91155.1 MAG: hypothetical protein A3E74_09160 [Omnitrophica bacterium RIFCSPHIGHO2_12_FULL_44_12]OGW95389.1 MAG: hypothetical protein A3G33_10420 [Omnitrophica bacterium RIFCSPLOWO2_12_FULL_44_17]OGX03275.1 MAG: hypothetical protein A3J12_07055 [Omnitrophica bacterium RIFCSPLOWO2_02_FULL_44_11]
MKKPAEEKILEDHISAKSLKKSSQRKVVLRMFLQHGKHLTADELYRIVQKKFPRIGYATIYRTLRLFCECGLSRELKLIDGITRFEPQHGYQHHDHLVCTCCGRLVEVVDPEIERLQEKLVREHGFYPESHRMELYGICRKCRK